MLTLLMTKKVLSNNLADDDTVQFKMIPNEIAEGVSEHMLRGDTHARLCMFTHALSPQAPPDSSTCMRA